MIIDDINIDITPKRLAQLAALVFENIWLLEHLTLSFRLAALHALETGDQERANEFNRRLEAEPELVELLCEWKLLCEAQ